MYRSYLINFLLSVSILIWGFSSFASQVAAKENLDTSNLRQLLEEGEKDKLAYEMKENGIFFDAVEKVVKNEGDEESKKLLSEAKDARHKVVILNIKGQYIKGLTSIKESNELLLRSINRVDDGISKVGGKEIQKKVEIHLIRMFNAIRKDMTPLLIKNMAFQAAAMMALEGIVNKVAAGFLKTGREMRRQAIDFMATGDRNKSKIFIKESTNNFIKAITLTMSKK